MGAGRSGCWLTDGLGAGTIRTAPTPGKRCPPRLMAEIQPLSAFTAGERRGIRYVLADIDDTLTSHGRLTAAAYTALEQLERSEEHTSELQSLMRISYAVFCLQKKNTKTTSPQ